MGNRSADKSLRLLEPLSGALTRPLQKYELTAHADKRKKQVRPPDKTDWWRPVRGNGVVSAENDKSLPSPVQFAWTASHDVGVCDLLISRDREFKNPIVVRGVVGGRCEVYHLHIGTRYFWKVTATDAGGHAVESAVRSFVTHATRPRWIRVPEISNVRDMGGWPLPGNRRVRQGLLYRSSEMNSHLHINEAGHRLLLDELKIRTVVDLRTPETEVPHLALNPDAVHWVNVPVWTYGSIVDAHYRDRWRQIFELLSEEHRYPILFHCWVGADRTGTLAFLIHGLLGMKLSDMIHDYELSSLSLSGERWSTDEQFQPLLRVLRPFAKDENDMQGQVGGYLRSIGITDKEMARIRALLTEPQELEGKK